MKHAVTVLSTDLHMDSMNDEIVIIAPGKPNEIFTCISSKSRPHPTHCWARAVIHISKNMGFNVFE